MRLRDLFWTSVRSNSIHDSNTALEPPGGPAEAGPSVAGAVAVTAATEDKTQPDFLTKQSLFTFSGGTIFVTVLWTAAKALGWDDDNLPPAVLAAVYTVVLFLWGATAKPRPDARANLLGALLAVVNGAQIFLAVIGAGQISGMT